MVILGPLEFRGMTDAWTEYLCIEQLADGGVELSSRSRELLGYGDWWLGDVVWPDGYVPDQDNPDADAVLPLTVAGKAVFGRDGDGIVGHELVPHSDDAVAVFRPEQSADARAWPEGYGWRRAPNFEAGMEKLTEILGPR